jgi:hypothetical protein
MKELSIHGYFCIKWKYRDSTENLKVACYTHHQSFLCHFLWNGPITVWVIEWYEVWFSTKWIFLWGCGKLLVTSIGVTDGETELGMQEDCLRGEGGSDRQKENDTAAWVGSFRSDAIAGVSAGHKGPGSSALLGCLGQGDLSSEDFWILLQEGGRSP